MNEEKKEQVLFAIFSAESKGLEGFEKAGHIVRKLETLYGGKWIVAIGGVAKFYAELGFLAFFTYEENTWIVGKVVGT